MVVIDDPARGGFPTPVDAVGTDPTHVGRIGRRSMTQNALDLFLCGDNLHARVRPSTRPRSPSCWRPSSPAGAALGSDPPRHPTGAAEGPDVDNRQPRGVRS